MKINEVFIKIKTSFSFRLNLNSSLALTFFTEKSDSRVFLLINKKSRKQQSWNNSKTNRFVTGSSTIESFELRQPPSVKNVRPQIIFTKENYVYLIKCPLARWCNSRSRMKPFNHVKKQSSGGTAHTNLFLKNKQMTQ